MENKIIVAGPQGEELARKQALFAEAFRQQRQKQHADDRDAVLRSLSLEEWQRFSLRWNLPPPFPKGWGDEEAQLCVMHQIRLMLSKETFTAEERRFSAAYLVGHGQPLPDGLTYENGELKGTAHGPGPIRR